MVGLTLAGRLPQYLLLCSRVPEASEQSKRELTGKEEEPSELIYFKVYKNQIPVIEQAIETVALMLGTDKSRGYCLEMICADFLAGAHLDKVCWSDACSINHQLHCVRRVRSRGSGIGARQVLPFSCSQHD